MTALETNPPRWWPLVALLTLAISPAGAQAQESDPNVPPDEPTEVEVIVADPVTPDDPEFLGALPPATEDETDEERGVYPGRSYTTSAFEDRSIESSEYFAWELVRVGLHPPAINGDAFDRFFGDDLGPMISTEFDVLPFRIPYVGRIGIGVGFGWAEFSGYTCVAPDCITQTDEETSLRLLPLSTLAVLRIDVLAREFNVPLLVTGKIGLDSIFFRLDTGLVTTTENVSLGLRWAVQAAFELDVINRRAARALDQEWSINHSFLFFELYGSSANSQLPVGTDLGWAAGLGLSL